MMDSKSLLESSFSTISNKIIWIFFLKVAYKGDHKTSDLKMSSTYNLSISDEKTTDTEEAAIAILAIHGFMTTPRGSNAPAANGIPIML